jgi:hypothetical protein
MNTHAPSLSQVVAAIDEAFAPDLRILVDGDIMIGFEPVSTWGAEYLLLTGGIVVGGKYSELRLNGLTVEVKEQ